MATHSQLLSSTFSLMAVLCWGTSDFTGGYASKRSDAFVVTLLAHFSGFVLMTALAIAWHAPFPSRSNQLWALAAGALGGTALAIFYRTLASGKMGLAAPVAAVLGAAIPTGYGIIVEGLPRGLAIGGFLLAGIGIWLMSRPDGQGGSSDGIGMALVAGVGFAGFFICINRTGESSALWSAAHSRLASLLLVGAIVLFRRKLSPLRMADVALGLVAGCLDSVGTLVFIRAEQTGRLDAAVVLSSLYPALTVLLARLILKESFSRWKAMGVLAALAAVPMIAFQ